MTVDVAIDPTETPTLVHLARSGDNHAWELLVDKYSRLVWAITRDFRITDSDASDVAQTTWLRLLEHIDRIDPAKIGAWLATTSRRECLRVLALKKRTMLTYTDDAFVDVAAEGPEVDESLLVTERAEDVRRAMSELPVRSRELLALCLSDPPMPYAEISATLGLPIGSIGPMRARGLAKLRTLLAE